MKEAGEFRSIAPRTSTTGPLLVMSAAVALMGAIITLAAVRNVVLEPTVGGGLGAGATTLAFGGLSFIGVWLWSANVRLLIGHGSVGYRDIFGRSRFWSQGEIAHVVSMAVRLGTPRALRGIYLFGFDGSRLLVLSTRAWKPNDLNDFVEAAGSPVDFREAPVAAKEARREFPSAFGWDARHMVTATTMTMLAAIAIVLLGYGLVTRLR